MQISIITLSKGVEKGLKLEEIITLLIKEDGVNYLFDKYEFQEQGLFLLGYLDAKGEITLKGKEFLKEIKNKKEILDKTINRIDFKALNLKLKEKLQLSYGSKQLVGFGGVYFIPTVPELQEFLGRFWKNYPEMKDINRIMFCLEAHIVKCSKERKFAPAVKYFIYKQGTGSQLAGAYENWEESKKQEENSFDGVNI